MNTGALYVRARTPRTRTYIPRHYHPGRTIARVPREWTVPACDPWAGR